MRLLFHPCRCFSSSVRSSMADSNDLPTADVELVPGDQTRGSVEIGATTVQYVVAVPAGFERGDSAPVLLAMPPGGQDIELTSALVRGTYLDESLRRGWVVVSPAAPAGRLYYEGSEEVIGGLLDWIETWVAPEGGGFHLVGISNGGISSFRIATRMADRILSMVVFPGFPRSTEDQTSLTTLTAIPVRMFVGEHDVGWIQRMQDVADRLSELGGDVHFEVMPNEGHVMMALADGKRLFDELDAAR